MIKRILVALDQDTDTPIAIHYAIKLAKTFDASMTGLAVVDTEHIAAEVGAGGIGTIYYAEQLREHLTEENRKKAGAILQTYEELVEKSNVRHAEIMEEGVPFERITEDLKYHDLLVIGRESHFFYNRPTKETKTLAQIVKNGSAPTLMVTESYRPVGRVLIAHDGSIASSRAIQWFVQLQPFGKEITIDLVYVCDTSDEETCNEGKLVTHLAADYLKAHEYQEVEQQLMDRKQDTNGEVLLRFIRDHGSDLVVMGAHSVSALKRLAFGSTTHEMVKQSPVPLFLSH